MHEKKNYKYAPNDAISAHVTASCILSLVEVRRTYLTETCHHKIQHSLQCFDFGMTDATAIPKPHSLLRHNNQEWSYLSGADLWYSGCLGK